MKRHLSNVFEKLGAVSRIDAVNKAKSMLILRFSGTPVRTYGRRSVLRCGPGPQAAGSRPVTAPAGARSGGLRHV
ncbi:hypothetical protein [Streptomyces halstedii]|uniref:hypothetical protein n=1 Tax=Streptomyces halstedii TaxID=1944 RepID=UPI0033615C98